MTATSAPDPSDDPPAKSRRQYDNSGRRAQTAKTRDQILDAAADMAHEFPSWDWGDLTFRSVAERAGVGARSMYRHFGSERELHDAVVRRLKEEAGVNYDDLKLEDLAEVTSRTFAALGTFPESTRSGPGTTQPALLAEHRMRRDALLHATVPYAGDWSDEQRTLVVAVLDLLWDVPAYERLVVQWGLDGEQAMRAVKWALDAVVAAIRTGEPPAGRPAADS
ncbi:TetR/AcrR family transcriptional regulator [Nocardia sp. BMG111209]|uniref:TetR/AcrR family transcriptional regulator n=1 Tax=Nocardia sp. BMG111209 TaxID=1160137 RepID=UPI00037D5CB5|nr:TetR/AcrR family transcriptional regulator [Nocardia sp. BMG111209]